MVNEVHLQPAYLLHSRPFRDTSVLLDFITRDYGRLSAIGRGVRRAGSASKGLLQPFTPLQISFSGKRELKTLRNAELLSKAVMLAGEQLFSALYMNELMVRLIHGHESDASLFLTYEQALVRLGETGEDIEPVLRSFEITLLEALGYGVVFDSEAETGESIHPEAHYHFQPESGFSRVDDNLSLYSVREDRGRYYPGNEIARIACQDFSAVSTRQLAKRLLRSVLAVYLGDRPLKSRQLFSNR